MKITVYTITDCPFSHEEKEYLKSHNLQFEEKNLETDRQYLTEMLTVSNNFAGTPVTKIEKDDGSIAVLKGFTREEFDKTLGLVSETPTAPVADASQAPAPVATAPADDPMPTPAVNDTPAAPAVNDTPAPMAPSPMDAPAEPVMPPMSEPPAPAQPTPTMPEPPVTVAPPTPEPPANPQSEALNSLLNDLQSKAQTPQANPPLN